MRGKAAVILSMGLGLLAVVMMSVYINARESQLLELSAMKDVLVATRDVLAGTAVDERMIRRIQVPTKYLQPNAIGDPRELIGRVVAVAVPRGAQFIGTYLEGAGETALAYEVPRGRRAITIGVSDTTGVGGLVRPGNFVDIIGTFEFGRPIGQVGGRIQYADERTETRMLLQNVLIVAVGQEHRGQRAAGVENGQERSLGQQAETEAREARRPRDVRNVTMLVSPHEAQELVLAQQIGTLTLSLRSGLDAGRVVDAGPLDPLTLLKVPIPVKPRAAPAWREIRGGAF